MVCALLGGLSAAARASIIDPQMGVEPAGDPDPFNGGVTFQPDAAGGGVFEYYNNTGSTIISLTFTTTLTGLTPQQQDDLLASLSCNQANDPTAPNPFFLFCSVNFFVNNGTLEFLFDGTNPGTGGLDEGIPPVLPGCVYEHDVPPSPGCTQGTFSISLNNDYSLTVDGGGWESLGNPEFTASVQTTAADAPEPAPALIVGLALLGGVFLAWRRRTRRQRRPVAGCTACGTIRLPEAV